MTGDEAYNKAHEEITNDIEKAFVGAVKRKVLAVREAKQKADVLGGELASLTAMTAQAWEEDGRPFV